MTTEEIKLDREDIVLLLMEANERLLKKGTLNRITRLVKLIFLLENETSFEGIGSFFPFQPHNFGPFSKEVYEAVEFLEACELIAVDERTYASPYAASDEEKLLSEISDDEGGAPATEKRFTMTEDGRKVARLMREAVERKRPKDVEAVDGIIRKYGTRPLNHLIRYVYHQYPAMTSKSVHPEAARVNHASDE